MTLHWTLILSLLLFLFLSVILSEAGAPAPAESKDPYQLSEADAAQGHQLWRTAKPPIWEVFAFLRNLPLRPRTEIAYTAVG